MSVLCALLLSEVAFGAAPTSRVPVEYLPDPAAAAVLSTSLGFGAGHFYAGNPQQGSAFFVSQAAGVTAACIGGAVATGFIETRDPKAGVPALTTGITLFVLSRMFDIATAPGAAHAAQVQQGEP